LGKASKKRKARAKRTGAKRGAVKKRTAKRRTTPAPRPAPPVTCPSPAEEAAYTRTVIATGEAARPDAEGKLPAGATHKIIEDEAGNVKVVRRRFSMTE
jgi:hypothetical protein